MVNIPWRNSVFKPHMQFKKVREDVHNDSRMVNPHCYLEILKRLREPVWRKRLELWPDKWILNHDNAPAHNALSVREFPTQKSISKLAKSLYFPDLAVHHTTFQNFKNPIKGHRFDVISDIQCAVMKILRSVLENKFQEWFWQWCSHLQKCVTSQGDYFEGDKQTFFSLQSILGLWELPHLVQISLKVNPYISSYTQFK